MDLQGKSHNAIIGTQETRSLTPGPGREGSGISPTTCILETGPSAAREPITLGVPSAVPGCPSNQAKHKQDLQHVPPCASHPPIVA